MRRRSFLQLVGLGAAAVAVPAGVAYSASVEDALAGIILHEFHFLKIDRTGVDEFVADYYKRTGANQQFFLNVKTKAYYLLKIDSERSQLVRTLTTLYLLSTDFFLNRMDERKEVKYLGWYNPHKTPCANPFSALYYPPAAS
ncbi:hypothetical protein I2I05_03775 [Hymenobacter sp. BT683]|uniref:Twin-arginine translocation signal domain-containing protein n=1 Tax=Hymenobacter jeongseonensis TaxID=2791027 RepID=A0ABS0IDS7_9BACT|nr:hypothetical protein [Hymenobacter jeongseonensis]MBF9236507.1 hypothetical protein [Hymenobacter jeongseonensis]